MTKIFKWNPSRTAIICACLSMIYFASGYCKWIEILACLVAIICMAIVSPQSALCIFMFMHCFTLSNIGYDSCFLATFVGFCLILLVKYIIGLKRGRYTYYKKLIIAIALFYSITALLSIGNSIYFGALMYLVYLPLAYLLFAMRSDLDIAQGMNYMFAGLLISCILAGIGLGLLDFQYYNNSNRFRAFINNTNYLYMRAIFVLAYYMYKNLKGELGNGKFLAILFACSLMALSTMSKTGIVMLLLFILIYLILCLKQNFKKNIKFVGIFIIALSLIGIICFDYIQSTLNRFITAFNSANLIRSLLTGRDQIWTLYFEAIFDSPFTALFGHGLLAKQIFIANIFGPTETHNFYIWLLYRFGILGTIGLGYIIYLFIKELNPSKPKLIAYLPMIFILLESLCDNTMKCYNITYFIFAFMILFSTCKRQEPTDIKSQQLEEPNK